MPSQWAIPAGSLEGKTAIVTGANSGIGFETAKALAAAGATVILACRRPASCAAAAESIRAEVPHDVDVGPMELDVGNLASVRAFSAGFLAAHERLDLLINNAGPLF